MEEGNQPGKKGSFSVGSYVIPVIVFHPTRVTEIISDVNENFQGPQHDARIQCVVEPDFLLETAEEKASEKQSKSSLVAKKCVGSHTINAERASLLKHVTSN